MTYFRYQLQIKAGDVGPLLFSLNFIFTMAAENATSTQQQRRRHRNIETFIIVYLSSDDTNTENRGSSIEQLRQVVNTVHEFSDTNECLNFLCDVEHDQVFLIIPAIFEKGVIDFVQHLPQIKSIYALRKNNEGSIIQCEQLVQESRKLKGIYSTISSVCDRLREDTKQVEINLTPINAKF
jgi:hypothetical protein